MPRLRLPREAHIIFRDGPPVSYDHPHFSDRRVSEVPSDPAASAAISDRASRLLSRRLLVRCRKHRGRPAGAMVPPSGFARSSSFRGARIAGVGGDWIDPGCGLRRRPVPPVARRAGKSESGWTRFLPRRGEHRVAAGRSAGGVRNSLEASFRARELRRGHDVPRARAPV
jgi:hypothetical protein